MDNEDFIRKVMKMLAGKPEKHPLLEQAESLDIIMESVAYDTFVRISFMKQMHDKTGEFWSMPDEEDLATAEEREDQIVFKLRQKYEKAYGSSIRQDILGTDLNDMDSVDRSMRKASLFTLSYMAHIFREAAEMIDMIKKDVQAEGENAEHN